MKTRFGLSAKTPCIAPHVHFSWPGSCDIGLGQSRTTSYGPVGSWPPRSPATAANPTACGAACAAGCAVRWHPAMTGHRDTETQTHKIFFIARIVPWVMLSVREPLWLAHPVLLREFEVRALTRAVDEFQYELTTRASPRLVSLPDVVVLPRAEVEGQPAAAGVIVSSMPVARADDSQGIASDRG